jgi:hypothetical protein
MHTVSRDIDVHKGATSCTHQLQVNVSEVLMILDPAIALRWAGRRDRAATVGGLQSQRQARGGGLCPGASYRRSFFMQGGSAR